MLDISRSFMKFTTAVFDLDGTLTDTIDDLTDSVNFALSQFAFPKRERKEVITFVGNGVRRLVSLSVPEGTDEETFEKVLAVFKDYYEEHSLVKTMPYKGIPELLKSLKSKGVKIAVVTNKVQSTANEVVNHFFPGIFDIIIGQVDGRPQKPAPDGVFDAMSKSGADKGKTVYIGDSDVDCKTAKNADLPIIGVSWGFKGREFLASYGCDYIVDCPEEIERIIIEGE